MSTITLPNIRVSSDLTVRVRLKDGGLAIDWSTLNNIKAHVYSDAQRALAGRCAVSVDTDDPTVLVCEYSANKPQYLGVNRIVVQARYMGETKTYDKPAFNFVRWTDDQEGEEITISDPDVDVEIDVEDVTSSILQNILDACIKATEEAQEVVDVGRGPRGYSAYEVAVQNGFEGTEEQWIASLKGEDGEPGTTPHIGQNGNWFIGDVDTGVAAGGQNGVTPHIGQNGNWFIGDTDTGVLARGTNGVTPHIGENKNWFIGETDTGILAEGTNGVTPHIGQNGHWYIGDVDTEVIAEGHDGEDGQDGQDGVGFDDMSTPAVPDGTVTITLSNGDTMTLDLNHNHPQYAKAVLCASVADYEAISYKDPMTLYAVPGVALYLGDTLLIEQAEPLPYTPVAYIQTDGVAFIDTGISGNAPMSFKLKMTPVAPASGNSYIIGSRKDSGNTRFSLPVITNDKKVAFAYYSGLGQGVSVSDSVDNQTPMDVKGILRNGAEIIEAKQAAESTYSQATVTYNNTVTTDVSLYIFGLHYPGNTYTAASGTKIFNVKIYAGDNYTNLIFNGVACYYEGEYGLWDKVSDSFFGNAAGSGAFTGPSIQ